MSKIVVALVLTALLGTILGMSQLAQASAPSKAKSVLFARSAIELRMVSPKLGWALTTHGLARTTDGGKAWNLTRPKFLSKTRLGCGINRSVLALDARGSVAWVSQACEHQANVAKTTIRVWRVSAASGGTPAATVLRLKLKRAASALNLDFINRKVGWLEVTSPCDCLNGSVSPSSTVLLKSKDSGIRWNRLPEQPQGLSILGFQSSTRGYAQAVSSLAGSDFNHFPLVTANGGRSWTRRSLRAPKGQTSQVVPFGAGFGRGSRAAIPVAMIDGSESVFAVYQTSNFGNRWTRTTTLREPGWGGWLAYMLNDRDGWVSGHSGLLRTTDGGRKWVRVSKSVGVDDSFHFVNPRLGFVLDVPVIGGFGGILKSTNGGRTWREMRSQLRLSQ